MVSMEQENVKKKSLVVCKIIFQVISRLIKYQNQKKQHVIDSMFNDHMFNIC